jgi:succinate dehydrogenase/fumarate reductase-like Fe-S protein
VVGKFSFLDPFPFSLDLPGSGAQPEDGILLRQNGGKKAAGWLGQTRAKVEEGNVMSDVLISRVEKDGAVAVEMACCPSACGICGVALQGGQR